MERIDKLLVTKNIVDSRSRAAVLVKEGKVLVNGEVVKKVSEKFDEDCLVEIQGEVFPWVSRGALKLLKALDVWSIKVQNKVCLDVGASTGGFTEVLLKNNAQKVFAIDVGHNQLAQKLKQDNRVTVKEKVNARDMGFDVVGEKVDLIVMDVSFISITLILENLLQFLKAEGEMIVLIKPQFEVGKEGLGKGGIVKDTALQKEVLENIKNHVQQFGLSIEGIEDSPIEGGDGNKEFLMYLKK